MTPGAPLPALLGVLVERARDVPPAELAGLIAAQSAVFGLDELTLYLQDYERQLLIPLPVSGRTLPPPERVGESRAGRAFSEGRVVEPSARARDGTVRVWVALLDGSHPEGVMSVVVDGSLARSVVLSQLASLVTDLIITKGAYTDFFFLVRRSQPMALAAEMQWQLLPPLSLSTPDVEVAGQLTPAYDVGGDSFDYALNGPTLHVAIFDAVGHGLGSAILANAVVGAYRHARRAGVSLADKYALVDEVVRAEFSDEHFVTAHLADLDVPSGVLRWVNAGHPRPLLVRDHRVAGSLRSVPTLPIGFGGERPRVAEERLERGDRVLFFTDGIIEEREASGACFGVPRLMTMLEDLERIGAPLHETVRRLSAELLAARGGRTSDDATALMIEWPGHRR